MQFEWNKQLLLHILVLIKYCTSDPIVIWMVAVQLLYECFWFFYSLGCCCIAFINTCISDRIVKLDGCCLISILKSVTYRDFNTGIILPLWFKWLSFIVLWIFTTICSKALRELISLVVLQFGWLLYHCSRNT